MNDIYLRPARGKDAPGVAACACAAYLHYIERIGKQPGPMLESYAEVIAQFQFRVATRDDKVVGAIVLKVTGEGFYIDNVSVQPGVKGQGVGRRLLELAESEARRQGYDSIYLATHELMTENQALYSRIGYVIYDHRADAGASLACAAADGIHDKLVTPCRALVRIKWAPWRRFKARHKKPAMTSKTSNSKPRRR